MKVVGIGQCSLDHIFIVDGIPQPDTKKEVAEWAIEGGGPVATALVSLARLGADCSFIGITGDDEAGEKITHSLIREGVDVSGIIKRRGCESQMAFILVEEKSGKRTIFWKRPAGEPLKNKELPHAFLEGAEMLLLDGLMSEVSLYAARTASEKGIPVMLDAGRMRKGMTEIAEASDYIVCSEEFAIEYAGGSEVFDPLKAILKMRPFGAKAVTITLGERGSVTMCGDEIFHTPAFKVKAADTTGAGDVFHGGYIYGLLKGWDIKDAVRFASAFAALKCESIGGRKGIPALDKIEAFLKKGF
ncbi:MAG: sugar kinase [Nitrospirae bacterium]|nr:sugar kinase [Nitrospirota bacterium]